ncbi:MAG: hypothetical protein Q4Q22_09010 [Methanosphaera sp.]|nr:hypothetical protein [Methanosphaera sp.]
MSVKLLSKQKAIERLEYIKNLNYTDEEYVRNMRKHMLKHRQNANGLLNIRLPAQQELIMFESYGFKNLKNYAIDVLEQNIEYCNVLECENHDEMINKTIEYLEKSNNLEYMLSLKPFSTKNDNVWYIPVDRLINWIDCYMIQKGVFFNYSTKDKAYLFVPNYFTDNVLLMTVTTDNSEENFNGDIDEILNVYDKLVNAISNILRQLPMDRNIDNLFTISDEKLKSNAQYIQRLSAEYMKFIEKELN